MADPIWTQANESGRTTENGHQQHALPFPQIFQAWGGRLKMGNLRVD